MQSPTICRIDSCQTWGTSSWVTCPGVSITSGGSSIREKDAEEAQLLSRMSSNRRYPKMLEVTGKFNDRWKDANIGGLYELKEDESVENSGGRPVYQKWDKTDFYLNYYEPFNEWGFRSKSALGGRRSYAYLKPKLVTYVPTDIHLTSFECHVFAEQLDRNGKNSGYRWQHCDSMSDGSPNVTIKESDWPNNIGLEIQPIQPVLNSQNTRRPSNSYRGQTRVRVTPRPVRRRRTTTTTTTSTTSEPTTLPTYTQYLFQREKYQLTPFASTYSQAKDFCERHPDTILANFNGNESKINVRWILSNQPWSNVRKMNGVWMDGNNRGILYTVREQQSWHICAYYGKSGLISDDCHSNHKIVCEATDVA